MQSFCLMLVKQKQCPFLIVKDSSHQTSLRIYRKYLPPFEKEKQGLMAILREIPFVPLFHMEKDHSITIRDECRIHGHLRGVVNALEVVR